MRSGGDHGNQDSGRGGAEAGAGSVVGTPFDGDAALRASEQKYRALFEAMDECAALCELVRDDRGRAVSWRYVDVNTAWESQSGLPRARFEGKLRDEVGVDTDDHLLPMFEGVVDRNEKIRFEYVSTSGSYYDVTAFACGGERFAILSDHIGATKRAEGAARESAARQAFLLALSDALRPLLDPTAIQDTAARMVAEHLGVARAYYAEWDEDAGTVTIHRDFVRGDARSICGVYPLSEVPALIDVLRNGQPFMTNDWRREDDPGELPRARIAELNMRAHLTVPLAKGGKILGTLSVSDSVPREWKPFDIGIVEETAERTWAAVERANAQKALEAREEQLAFIDEISQAMAVAAPEGEILNRISQRIATHLRLSHCTFLDVDCARGEVTTTFGWQAQEPPRALPRTYRMADYHLTPDFERAARAGETVVVGNTATDRRTAAGAYAALGILAFVTIPFHREGEWKFLLAVADSRPREWSASETQLLRQLSERIFPRVERARAEAALRESEAHYHSLFEMMDEGFAVGEIIRDDSGRAVDYRIVELNRAYEKHVGRTRENIIGRPMRARVPSLDPMWLREFGGVVDSGQPARFEYEVTSLGRWFDVRAFARGGDRFGILFDDVTIQKRAAEAQKRAHEDEIRLREAANEANRAKDEFMALLGHELRNPLTPILATLDLMRLQGKKVFVSERALIERQARHLARLVDDLLDVTRIARGKVKLVRHPVDVGQLISRAVETVSPVLEEKGHRLMTSIDPGLFVEGDADRLVQVVANLLANAAKYTHPTGCIEVRGHEAADGGVVLEVRDNGSGIPGELLPHVFDLFRQGPQASDRAQGGLGLGLAIVRNIVELHGGRVSAASDGPRKGSTFIVWLPRADARSKTPEKPARRRRAASEGANGRRILVVDDNRDSTEVLALLLTRRGYEVEVAHDAVAGLKGAIAFRPAVALLDIGLPEMDGYELARRLKAKRSLRHLRLIAVTGYGQPSDREKAFDAGFSEHVTKPFEFERLAELIEADQGDAGASPAVARRSGTRRPPHEARRPPVPKRHRSRR